MTEREPKRPPPTVEQETIAQMILDTDKKGGALQLFLQRIVDEHKNKKIITREDILEDYSGGNAEAEKALIDAMKSIPALPSRIETTTDAKISPARVLFDEMVAKKTEAEIRDYFSYRRAQGIDRAMLIADYTLTEEETSKYL